MLLVLKQLEGSVDEESTKSDEEYDDLAMQDGAESGYRSDDDEKSIYKMESNGARGIPLLGDQSAQDGDGYGQNLDAVMRTKSDSVSELPALDFASRLRERSERRVPHSCNVKLRKLSPSIPPSGKHSSIINFLAVEEPLPR